MKLSWLLDVDIILKLISIGVPLHERDSSGMTILEHVFQANASDDHLFCSYKCPYPKGFSTFKLRLNFSTLVSI